MPDIHHYMNVTKEKTHFTKQMNGQYYFDYDQFHKQYHDKIKEPLYIGYDCHLLVDNIWLETVHNKYFALRSKKKGLNYMMIFQK